MDKYVIRTVGQSSIQASNGHEKAQQCVNKGFLEVDLKYLPADPAKRPKISAYHPNDRDEIRRAYLQKGPCQSREHEFPQKNIGNSFRRFNAQWFDEYADWLEYSKSMDFVFCLYYYLMRSECGDQGGAGAFDSKGFSNCKDKARLGTHVGGINSAHNEAYRKCLALMNQKQHIETAILRQSDKAKKEYRLHLTAVIDCIRFLLRQGLSFRGHHEYEGSINQGNFLELLQFLSNHNEEIGQVLKQVHGNLKLTSSNIQKDIISAAASETTKAILSDIGDDFFAVLIDESRDISIKEQMAIALRYLDRQLQELNNRFTEVNTELLLCVACLNPRDAFIAFDKLKLILLAQFYPSNFSLVELASLDNQLENYIIDVRSDNGFLGLMGMSDLSEKLVDTKKHIVYPLVYLLLKLALILPVATATVERTFFAMNIIKNRLRNRMGDDLLNDCLVTFIEKDVFDSIDNELIIYHF